MANKALIDPIKKRAKEFEEQSVALQRKMDRSALDSRAESLAQNVLRLVSNEHYDRAIEQINQFTELRPEYPDFKPRVERFVTYAIDLVNGIKAKRKLAMMKQLASAKQKELYDRALAHFDDLKHTLKRIELIEREVKLEDIRSTVWVVKAMAHCTFALLLFFFVAEISGGVMEAAGIVADDVVNQIVDKTFNYLGL